MNILFILIDTLRADHLGCYGYHYDTSPTIDWLAKEGVLVETHIATAIPTHPAHTTIYTGRHPLYHQIVSHGGQADLRDDIPVFPEILQQLGYTTCAVDNLYDGKKWFARGYEFYINPSFRHKARLLISAEEINQRAIPWLKAYSKEKFFLFLHYWDPHTPYIPPPRYRSLFYQGDPCNPDNPSLEVLHRQPLGDFWMENWFPKLLPNLTDIDYIRAMYDAEIRYVDDAIAELLEALDETGVAEDTLVILTSDHGESLTEHDIYFEHHGLYEPTLHVPLILRWPSGGLIGGRRVKGITQHTDFAPTLLALAGTLQGGLKGQEKMEFDGLNLFPWLSGEREDPIHPYVIAEECTWQAKWCLRTETHKLILARQPDLHNMPMRELYNLKEDPQEEENLALKDWKTAQKMEAQLEKWLAERMQLYGLDQDPLLAQGITLGKRWLESRRQALDLPDKKTGYEG